MHKINMEGLDGKSLIFQLACIIIDSRSTVSLYSKSIPQCIILKLPKNQTKYKVMMNRIIQVTSQHEFKTGQL